MFSRLEYVWYSWDYKKHFDVKSPDWDIEKNLQPGSLATFIRRNPALEENLLLPDREVVSGTVGIPLNGRFNGDGSRRYRAVAKVETVHETVPFCDPWRAEQRCIIPVHAFWKSDVLPNLESRYRKVFMKDDSPMGIAGIWCSSIDAETDEEVLYFAMLSISGEGHPLVGRFHNGIRELRMPLILPTHRYESWLETSSGSVSELVTDCARLRLGVYPKFNRPKDQYL
jgi:putative SOS response-associated peptidase YedK